MTFFSHIILNVFFLFHNTLFFSLCLIISSPDFILSCFHVSSTVMFALDVMNIGISLPHDTNEYSILNYIRFLHILTYIQHKTDIQRERSKNIINSIHIFVRGFLAAPLLLLIIHTISFLSAFVPFCYFYPLTLTAS